VSEQNKALVRRALDEVWSKGNVDLIDQLLTPDCTIFSSPGFRRPNEKSSGHGSVKQFVTSNRGAFPDLQLTIDDLVAEQDKVVARFTVSGTHKAEFLGHRPTGKRAQVSGISVFYIAGDKIREVWGVIDSAGLMEQLGMFPPTQR
jgi:steroid delta-isomerase-like uncharacterized protein